MKKKPGFFQATERVGNMMNCPVFGYRVGPIYETTGVHVAILQVSFQFPGPPKEPRSTVPLKFDIAMLRRLRDSCSAVILEMESAQTTAPTSGESRH